MGPVNPAGWRLVIRFGVKRGARAGPEGSDEAAASVRGPEVTAASVRGVSRTGVPAWPALVSRCCCFDLFLLLQTSIFAARAAQHAETLIWRALCKNNDATRAFSQ